MTVNKGEISVSQGASGFTGESNGLQMIDLMTSDEVGRFFSRQSKAQVLIWPGADPIALDRVQYFDFPYFKGKFTA
jgi:type IV secretory pathway TraG/TraD family ATPase VirD4